ncbi:MAG: alkaline phosphatase family protein [Gemmatimonadota bacterium]
MPDSAKVLFIFLDGVGVGPPDAAVNPFLNARLPTLRGLLNDRIPVLGREAEPSTDARTGEGPDSGAEAISIPLDALMGVEGLPQSGTGQTALLTGENAAVLYGRHFGPWVPVPLRPLLMEKNVLSRARAEGISYGFANAYPSRFIHLAWTKRPAGPALAAHAAGVLTRQEEDLGRGEAVSSEILNTAWRTRLGLTYLPEVTPEEAGRNLARITRDARLTFFAHYSTDTAGHKRTMPDAVAALERVDGFLGGVVPALPPKTLLVVASDHGNIEDISQGHTRNPTFGLLWGPGAKELGAGLSGITDIPGLILRYLTSVS